MTLSVDFSSIEGCSRTFVLQCRRLAAVCARRGYAITEASEDFVLVQSMVGSCCLERATSGRFEVRVAGRLPESSRRLGVDLTGADAFGVLRNHIDMHPLRIRDYWRG